MLFFMSCSVVGFIVINRRAPSGLLRPFINLVQQLTVMLVCVAWLFRCGSGCLF